MQDTVYRQYFNIWDVDELWERIVEACNHLHQLSLILPSDSGALDFMLVFEKKGDSLITNYNICNQ